MLGKRFYDTNFAKLELKLGLLCFISLQKKKKKNVSSKSQILCFNLLEYILVWK